MFGLFAHTAFLLLKLSMCQNTMNIDFLDLRPSIKLRLNICRKFGAFIHSIPIPFSFFICPISLVTIYYPVISYCSLIFWCDLWLHPVVVFFLDLVSEWAPYSSNHKTMRHKMLGESFPTLTSMQVQWLWFSPIATFKGGKSLNSQRKYVIEVYKCVSEQ